MTYNIYYFYSPFFLVFIGYIMHAHKAGVLKYKVNSHIFLIFIFITIAFRSLEVGNDTTRYYSEFNNSVYDLAWGGRGSEVGFTYTLSFFKKIGFSFLLFNILYSFIVVYAILRIFSENRFQLFFILLGLFFSGYFFMSMTGMRQMLAVSIFLISCYEPKSIKDIIIKIAMFTFSISIHNSSIIGVPIVLGTILHAAGLSNKIKYIVAVALAALVVLVINKIDYDLVFESTKYDFYFSTDELRTLNIWNVVFWIFLAICSILASVSTLKSAEKKANLGEISGLGNNFFGSCSPFIHIYASVLMALIYYMGLSIPLMDRFSYYFQPFIFGAIGIYVANIRRKKLRLLFGISLFTVGVLFMSRLLTQDPFGLLALNKLN